MLLERDVLATLAEVVSELALVRRLTSVWIATGVVPVAHIVAELDDPEMTARPMSYEVER